MLEVEEQPGTNDAQQRRAPDPIEYGQGGEAIRAHDIAQQRKCQAYHRPACSSEAGGGISLVSNSQHKVHDLVLHEDLDQPIALETRRHSPV